MTDNDKTKASENTQDAQEPKEATAAQPQEQTVADVQAADATPVPPAPQTSQPQNQQYAYSSQTGQPYNQQQGYSYNQQQYQQYNPQQNYQYTQQNAQYNPQPQYAPQQSYQSRTAGIGSAKKDKWVAVLLALVPFFGAFGLHKFYLGYKTEGLVMLLVAILGSCLFGLGYTVMVIIGLIEGVRYAILTQEDFDATYVRGSKGWF
jgi:TM2 domain-containing membrane protein YozV